ncbi:MAG TPA: DNA repair protein RecO [Methylococcaceae bacterium]|nr:DNA repair protein RecO [Methylococcaceae bacterium]HIN68810.1 DNA repair protein RecO [Methylococcales bacterium]HIA45858.1 DNA repair protein RecO [Methylococcaceae bacterium]HIB62593.1 DNA repair protein RecO [Methylococcaceae bacterium]HIO12884.1 DNA repair protein RecO [Methylococcales bacterium]
MTSHAVYSQTAFVLHTRKYRETSLLVDVFTCDYGIVTLVAKGVRKKNSKWVGVLQCFQPLEISFSGRSELKTLTGAALHGRSIELTGLVLYCGFYLNELLIYFLHKHDAHPEVFEDYRYCLVQLVTEDSVESVLRIFELALLENLGYGLQLENDAVTERPIDPNQQYDYLSDIGPVPTMSQGFSGKSLIALRKKILNDELVRKEAKQLMRQVIDFHLQGRELKSRALISQFIRQQSVTTA